MLYVLRRPSSKFMKFPLKMLHIDPTTGQKVKSIPFPTANITSAAFGGENLDTLFVTSATSGLSQVTDNHVNDFII